MFGFDPIANALGDAAAEGVRLARQQTGGAGVHNGRRCFEGLATQGGRFLLGRAEIGLQIAACAEHKAGGQEKKCFSDQAFARPEM